MWQKLILNTQSWEKLCENKPYSSLFSSYAIKKSQWYAYFENIGKVHKYILLECWNAENQPAAESYNGNYETIDSIAYAKQHAFCYILQYRNCNIDNFNLFPTPKHFIMNYWYFNWTVSHDILFNFIFLQVVV